MGYFIGKHWHPKKTAQASPGSASRPNQRFTPRRSLSHLGLCTLQGSSQGWRWQGAPCSQTCRRLPSAPPPRPSLGSGVCSSVTHHQTLPGPGSDGGFTFCPQESQLQLESEMQLLVVGLLPLQCFLLQVQFVKNIQRQPKTLTGAESPAFCDTVRFQRQTAGSHALVPSTERRPWLRLGQTLQPGPHTACTDALTQVCTSRRLESGGRCRIKARYSTV